MKDVNQQTLIDPWTISVKWRLRRPMKEWMAIRRRVPRLKSIFDTTVSHVYSTDSLSEGSASIMNSGMVRRNWGNTAKVHGACDPSIEGLSIDCLDDIPYRHIEEDDWREWDLSRERELVLSLLPTTMRYCISDYCISTVHRFAWVLCCLHHHFVRILIWMSRLEGGMTRGKSYLTAHPSLLRIASKWAPWVSRRYSIWRK